MTPILLLGGCVLEWTLISDEPFFTTGYRQAQGVRWAGFGDHDDLRVEDYHSECGIDCMVKFRLVGSPDAIDRALGRAGVTSLGAVNPDTAPVDLGNLGWPLKGVDPSSLESGTWVEDQIGASGTTVYRTLLRVPASNGEEQLLVAAFTT